jgi:hypothetical protein
MAHVRGPFIEYECSVCGTTVQENAPYNMYRLVNRIAEANTIASTRICAPCWNPVHTEAASEAIGRA